MLALIMAGGEGNRLNLGEKPLVTVAGIPMIAHVVRAFSLYGCEVVVVTSKRTPMTQNWCRATGVEYIPAGGGGYIEDMETAVSFLEEPGPLFVAVSDLPCLTAGIIRTVHDAYSQSGKDACSVWVPVSLFRSPSSCVYVEKIGGHNASPAGVNILRGDMIGQPQDELQLLLKEPRLASNVNTREDLAFTDSYLRDHADR